jgi:hypothetical protein
MQPSPSFPHLVHLSVIFTSDDTFLEKRRDTVDVAVIDIPIVYYALAS